MTVAFAAIVPHGWALVPALSDDAAGAQVTRAAMLDLGRWTAEVIVVITPHGVRVDGACTIADVARGAGLLRWEGRQLEMNVAIDGALTAAIADDARAAGAPLVRVGFAGHSGAERVVPLDWGTMVPLWFLGHDRDQPGRGDVLADPPPAVDDVGPPVVIVTPARGLAREALIEVGRVIGRACERDPRRVAVIASCDWSHAHPSAVADRVERAVLDAIAAGDLGALAALDAQEVDDAAVDGLWQALVLAGALEVAPAALELLSYEAPPRYATGMIVAAGARGAEPASPRPRDRSDCRYERGSDTLAREAIVHLLGDLAMRDTVDLYVSGSPGSELARSVLWLLHPWPAMQRCHEIFASDAGVDERRSAVELLRVVADHRALPWIAQYLADPDPEIRAWGIGVVDQLLNARLIEEDDAAEILAAARVHGDPHVRELAIRIEQERHERG